jgi:type III pantothenate kinase
VLLAVSIGNSHITFGIHGNGSWARRWRVQTAHGRTSDEYLVVMKSLIDSAGIPAGAVDRSILSSVVPPLTAALVTTMTTLAGREPLMLSPKLDLGIRVTTENPAEVGSDLVANAVAAFDRVRGNCIVVDFGTALSFTAVSAGAAGGELRGVAIAPGLASAVEGLARSTAQLPAVFLAAPPAAIGRNTVHSIQAGIVFGYTGLVNEIIRRMRAELGGDTSVIVTGGHATVMAPLLGPGIAVDEWLTLEGLRIIAGRNDR